MEIRIQRTERPAAKPDEKGLSFGKYFTDHMFEMDYDSEHGWHDARIVPFGPLSLHPAATVFHYGAEVFEGLKAYRAADGGVRLFRPWENVARLNNSARRLCLPPLNLCGDNAAMVALQGYYEYKCGARAASDLNASAV